MREPSAEGRQSIDWHFDHEFGAKCYLRTGSEWNGESIKMSISLVSERKLFWGGLSLPVECKHYKFNKKFSLIIVKKEILINLKFKFNI